MAQQKERTAQIQKGPAFLIQMPDMKKNIADKPAYKSEKD